MPENRKASTKDRHRLAYYFGKRGKQARKARFSNNPKAGHDFPNRPALKCLDPYYDINTRYLKNEMDLSQKLGESLYKNNPVKNWNSRNRRLLPCEDDDYVRLVNDNFCCETAEQRGKNPLTKEPDYNRKLKERQKAYEDLYVVTPEEQSAAEAAGNKPKSPAQYRRKTVEMNEDLMMN